MKQVFSSNLVHEKEKGEREAKHHASEHLKEFPLYKKNEFKVQSNMQFLCNFIQLTFQCNVQFLWNFIKLTFQCNMQFLWNFIKLTFLSNLRQQGRNCPRQGGGRLHAPKIIFITFVYFDFIFIGGFSPGNKDSLSWQQAKRTVALKVVQKQEIGNGSLKSLDIKFNAN